LAVHLGVLLVVGSCGDASAKSARRHWHARRPHSQTMLAAWFPAPAQQRFRLGPMRYYGGPKSPMWRAPAEN